MIVAIAAAAAVIVGIAVVPRLLGRKGGIPTDVATGGQSPEAGEPPSSDPNVLYIRSVQKNINAGDFEAALENLDKSPSRLPPFEKEALQKRLREAYLKYIDSRIQSGSFFSRPRRIGRRQTRHRFDRRRQKASA